MLVVFLKKILIPGIFWNSLPVNVIRICSYETRGNFSQYLFLILRIARSAKTNFPTILGLDTRSIMTFIIQFGFSFLHKIHYLHSRWAKSPFPFLLPNENVHSWWVLTVNGDAETDSDQMLTEFLIKKLVKIRSFCLFLFTFHRDFLVKKFGNSVQVPEILWLRLNPPLGCASLVNISSTGMEMCFPWNTYPHWGRTSSLITGLFFTVNTRSTQDRKGVATHFECA